jgi:hypothetical protein
MFLAKHTTQASKSTTASKTKRWASVVAGTLFLSLALSGYDLYAALLTQSSTVLACVPRMEFAAFEAAYSKQIVIRSDGPAKTRDAQGVDNSSLYVIDVRSAASYAEGHIRGAISVPEPEVATRIGSVVQAAHSDAFIVLYCA